MLIVSVYEMCVASSVDSYRYTYDEPIKDICCICYGT